MIKLRMLSLILPPTRKHIDRKIAVAPTSLLIQESGILSKREKL